MSERNDVLKVRGCIVTKEGFAEIEIEREEDLIKIAKRYNLPIIECVKEGYEAVVDVGHKIIFKHRMKSCEQAKEHK